jgi:DNA-binding MarR family transcriptional regulator
MSPIPHSPSMTGSLWLSHAERPLLAPSAGAADMAERRMCSFGEDGIAQRDYVKYLTFMRDGPDVVAAQDLRLAIGRVARRLRQLYATEHEGAANFIELGILVRLEREGPTSPSTLAAGEGVTSQAIAGVVRDLERRALVERTGEQADRRRVAVAITDAGRELLMNREHVVVRAMVRALADEYTAAERRQLESVVALLNRLAKRL